MILFIAAGIWLLAFVTMTIALSRQSGVRTRVQIDLAAIGAILLGTCGFFWRLIFSADIWMPAGGGDLAGFLYPTYHFAAEWWRQGVIPLWNPQLFAGQPFVGDIQSGIFYPINLLVFLTSAPLTYRDMELLSVLHYAIAGIGMYSLLRWGKLRSTAPVPPMDGSAAPQLRSTPQLSGLGRLACLAGAVTFEFSDLFIIHFGNLNLIASAAWLPFVFLFLMLAIDGHIDANPADRPTSSDSSSGTGRYHFSLREFGPSAIGGIFLALSFLAGHIQSFLFIVFAIVLYAGFRIIKSRQDSFRILIALAVLFIVALGLSAITLFPGVEMSRASVRSSFPYEDAAQYSLPPAELIGLLVPGFFGRSPTTAWGPWARVEVGYLGIFPLVLAGLALVIRKDSRILFFGLTAIAGLAFALGGYGILHGWLYEFVPGFGQLRAPARFILLLDFGLAALAAIGFDTLTRPLDDNQRRTLGRIARTAPWGFLLVALASCGVAFSILILGQGQDPVLFARISNAANSLAFFILLLAFSVALLIAREKGYFGTTLWSFLALGLIAFDLYSLGAYVDIGLSDPTAAYNRQDTIGFLQSQPNPFRIDSRTDSEGTWLADTALLYGLYDLNGDNPLVLSEFDRFWESLGSRASQAYDLLNAKYIIARKSTQLDAKFRRVFDGASGISVYENQNVLPRAWLVHTAQFAQTDAAALTMVNSPEFDPRQRVILAGGNQIDSGNVEESTDEVSVVGYGPNQIEIEVTSRTPGYLVLSEIYYPGWTAFIDGVETEIVRANFAFRAVRATTGLHRIRFVYFPFSFQAGAMVTVLTIAGLIAAGLISLRKKHFYPGG